MLNSFLRKTKRGRHLAPCASLGGTTDGMKVMCLLKRQHDCVVIGHTVSKILNKREIDREREKSARDSPHPQSFHELKSDGSDSVASEKELTFGIF